MKSYIKLLMLGGVLAATATSCTDLDTPVITNYEQFPDNNIASYGDFNKCYFYIRNEAWLGRNFWETVFMQGDEAMGVNFAGNYFDNGRYFFCSIHQMRPDHTSGGQESDLLSGLTYTNSVIKQYSDPDGDGKDARVAPLRAIRAFYTFLFMDMYGDTPIMDRVFLPEEKVDRAPRAKVAQWIEQELLEAIPDLSEANDETTYGTPNKWMAMALLAKLYLNWGVYTNPITSVTSAMSDFPANEKLDDCVAICDEIITTGPFEVGDGYRKKFYPDNGLQIKDFIYACPMDPYTYGNGYWGGWQPNRFFDFRSSGLMKVGTWGWSPKEAPAGVYVLIPECVDRFNLPGDERNDMIACGPFAGYDSKFDRIPLTYDADGKVTNAIQVKSGRRYKDLEFTKDIDFVDITLGDVGAESTVTNLMKGARLYKYPPLEEDYDGRWDKKGLQSNDIPIFRYADILLTKAECLVRGVAPTLGKTAADYINEVRDCSHAPHFTGTPTIQDVMDERGREFVMEMWRRNDLIRCGMFENDWGWKHVINPSAKTDFNLRLMPLSNGTLGTNTNWSQNPGY